jgi:hypothetical protein
MLMIFPQSGGMSLPDAQQLQPLNRCLGIDRSVNPTVASCCCGLLTFVGTVDRQY